MQGGRHEAAAICQPLLPSPCLLALFARGGVMWWEQTGTTGVLALGRPASARTCMAWHCLHPTSSTLQPITTLSHHTRASAVR